jgi:parallel beta-helix repeat protein
MRPAVAFFATLALSFASRAALADTVNVPAQQPTIQAAVDAAKDGDTIVVAAGKYRESVTIASRTGLRLQAAAGATVLPAATGAAGFRVTGSTDVTIDGFAIARSRAEGVYADSCTRLVVSHCTVTRSRFDAIRVDGSSDCEVSDCTVKTTGRNAVGVSLSFGGAVSSDRCSVLRCNVSGTGGEGIDAHGDSVLIEDCTITRPRNDGIELDRDAPTTNCTVRRCTIVGAGDVGIVVTGTGNLVESNTVRGASFHGISIFDGTSSATTGDTVRTNVVVGTRRHDGIEVLVGGCTIDANAVSRTRQDGIYLSQSANVATNNIVLKAGLYGFEIVGSNHTLTGNSATGSRRADLADSSTGSTFSGNDFPRVRK